MISECHLNYHKTLLEPEGAVAAPHLLSRHTVFTRLKPRSPGRISRRGHGSPKNTVKCYLGSTPSQSAKYEPSAYGESYRHALG
jgi:hypothetical protein